MAIMVVVASMTTHSYLFHLLRAEVPIAGQLSPIVVLLMAVVDPAATMTVIEPYLAPSRAPEQDTTLEVPSPPVREEQRWALQQCITALTDQAMTINSQPASPSIVIGSASTVNL